MQTDLQCLVVADKDTRKSGPCMAEESTDRTSCVYFGIQRLILVSFHDVWHC